MINRKVILPPYMEDVQAWLDLTDSIDTVFETAIDDTTKWLTDIRDLWIIPPETEAKIQNYELLRATDLQPYEREILVKQCNMLGFAIEDADLLLDDDFRRIGRNISQYWYAKGKPNFIDFLGFVLNTVITVKNLWCVPAGTDGYGPFFEEGDPGIGTAVWDGGPWFPTTHVNLEIDSDRFLDVSQSRIIALFNTIANYNLVVNAILVTASLRIHTYDDPVLANCVVAYPMFETSETTQDLAVAIP